MPFGQPRLTSEQRRAETMERRHAPAPAVTVKPLGVGRYSVLPHPQAGQALAKPQTFRSEKWLAAVRSLECCVRCGRHGVQAAHRNQGKGMALKQHDAACAALCPECHTELDSGKTLNRDEKRAEMDRCIVLTVIALAASGKVRPT